MQIFRPGADTIATLLLVSVGVMPVLAVGLGYQIVRSPYVTDQNVTRDQPVPFSHEHHVGGLGLDCRYCHTSVEDIDKHLVPGAQFAIHDTGAQLFFGLYWLVTGVHAIHLSIGMVLVIRLAVLGYLDRLQLDDNPEIEVTALYWHLVDVIWIFLYPLIYLPGRVS